MADLLGGSPSAHPERYRLASPLARLPTGIPVRCVHDRQEDLVPFDQSSAHVDAAVAADDDAVLDPTNVSWTDTITWLCPRFQP